MTKLVCFGEVLWDLFPSGAKPGGAPMNVAMHAKNLGLDSHVYSAVGNDQWGTELLNIIQERQVGTLWVDVIELPTGTVTVDTTNPSEVQYTIEAPSAWDQISFHQEVANMLGKGDALVFGTLACRNPHNVETLMQLLDTEALKVLDVNLRAPFYSPELVGKLLSKADLLKVNEEEYQILSQWFQWPEEPHLGYAQLARDGLSYLVVTKGRNGSQLFWEGGMLQSATFSVHVKDTVGAGDSFLAALISGILQGHLLQETLDQAAALGAMVAAEEGANPIFTPAEISEFARHSRHA